MEFENPTEIDLKKSRFRVYLITNNDINRPPCHLIRALMS